MNAKTDASNFKRPADAFDRFAWLAEQVEGPTVLDIGSGHAVTMKRVKARHPDWNIICSDQTEAARKAANWPGEYLIMDAYDIADIRKGVPGPIVTITISQALEYLEFPDKFMKAAQSIAEYFVCTVPEGEMRLWSQLHIFEEHSFKEWLSKYGDIVHFDKVPGLMLLN